MAMCESFMSYIEVMQCHFYTLLVKAAVRSTQIQGEWTQTPIAVWEECQCHTARRA
jgi:hypothetical protein